MGSINKLSTIKSVFIVPINEHMSKIKIDFFIAPKETQQNRSAKFIIHDINSNKIYLKYFQKTDEMSIKDIQDTIDNVKNITSKIDNLEKSIYLKNLFNELYHKVDIKVSHIFFDKTFLVNAKKTDFLEIQFKILLVYDDSSNAKYVNTNLNCMMMILMKYIGHHMIIVIILMTMVLIIFYYKIIFILLSIVI